MLTKFMGETAAKLRLVFDALAETRGVYFFDEVDALGSERASNNDVGEIRRVLNSFLQFLEEDTSDSVIIAATNHPRLLDSAVFRRFDRFVAFDLPRDNEIKLVIENRLALFDLAQVEWPPVLTAARGLCHSEITTAAENTAKQTVLSGKQVVTTEGLAMEFKERSMLPQKV